MNIALIGMAGSGKTTTGKALAAHLGREFVDCDDLIPTYAGKSIAQIFF
ncbi:shikimate kinase [gut metagenome]|uniref:Shikimate kinase n=1 Tax=gut metagenome TaxID=749906 RepID=J9G3D9_9ZZZZ